MSKLNIVDKHLRANSNTKILNVIDNKYFPDKCNSWNQTINYIVVPKEAVFAANELQQIMMRLVPEQLELSGSINFRQLNNQSNLELGKLYFDENIGEEKVTRVFTLSDDDLLNSNEIVDRISKKNYSFDNGKKIIETTKLLSRRICVNLYPSIEYARDLNKGKIYFGESEADVKTLKKYKPKNNNFFGGLFEKLFV